MAAEGKIEEAPRILRSSSREGVFWTSVAVVGVGLTALIGALYGYDNYSFSHSELEGFSLPAKTRELKSTQYGTLKFVVPRSEAAELVCGKYNRALNTDIDFDNDITLIDAQSSIVSCIPDHSTESLFGQTPALP